MKLEEIATKARSGEELTEEEIEFVIEVLQAFVPIIEQTWEWVRNTAFQVAAVWLDSLAKLEEERKK